MAIRQELFEAFDLKRVLGFAEPREKSGSLVSTTRMKFCIYNARKGGRTKSFQVAFNIRSPEQLSQVMAGECLTLPVSLVKEFSPEALAIMELGSQKDIDIASKMYEQWPKFGDEEAGPPYRFYMREVDMGNDRELFEEDSTGLPVYEGRMVGSVRPPGKGVPIWTGTSRGLGRVALWPKRKVHSTSVVYCSEPNSRKDRRKGAEIPDWLL